MILLTLSVCLLIVGVSLTSYYISKSVLQEELSSPQQQMLRINMSFMDAYIREADQLAVNLSLQQDVYRFLHEQGQPDHQTISALYQHLSTLLANNNSISSLYIYDKAHDRYVTMPGGYHSRSSTLSDADWTTVADEFGDRRMLVKLRRYSDSLQTAEQQRVTLFRKIVIAGEERGIIAVNFAHDELFDKLHYPADSQLERMRLIYDDKGERLFATGDVLIGTDEEEAVLTQLAERAHAEIEAGGQILLATQLESPLTGWTYLSLVTQDSLLAKTKKVRNVVFSVSLIALVLGGGAVFYLNAVAFRPVRRMKQLFKMESHEHADLARIEHLTVDLMSDHAKLSGLVRRTMGEAAAKFLFDYCMGIMSGRREIASKWSAYFQDWSSACLYVAVISIDDYAAWTKRYSLSDHALLKFALGNIAGEVFGDRWRCEAVDLGKERVVLLLQPKDSEAADADEPLGALVKVVAQILKFSVSAGISSPISDIYKLPQALFEADNALGYRLYEGEGAVIAYRKVADHEAVAIEQEVSGEAVAAAIEAGDGALAAQRLNHVCDELAQGLLYPNDAWQVLQLIAKRLFAIDPSNGWEAEEWLEAMHTVTLGKIRDNLIWRAESLAAGFARKLKSKDYWLCQQMIDYMKRHIGEPIGNQEIAESAGIGVSLASHLFKQETGETIYNYFTRLRMEKAAAMLLAGNARIAVIAEAVGYQHENSFIRVFRKHYDMTPGKYRERRNPDSSAAGEE